MQVTVNGEKQELEATVSVADLVVKLGLTGRRIAVEVNGEIVPRSLHAGHKLNAGDRVEVVHAIGGG
jgi:sulfur carrier protein